MDFGPLRSLPRVKQALASPFTAGMSICLVLFSACLFLPGCLTRSAKPSLPYVTPAQSVPQVDPAAIQMAARMQDLESEVQRLRDQIERLQASGGNQAEIRNLHERVAVIERQLGIESPGSARGARQSGEFQEPPPAGRQTRDLPPTERKPPRLFAPEHEAAPIEIVDQPVTPEERDFKDAYLALRRQSPEEAFQLFEQFLKKYPKNPLASDAVYWMGEAKLAQGRFDEAVLQFDRVIKEFPGSKKELDALLKQGYAFEKMGDQQSAQIIFRKLTKEHPHTAQARNAASKLKPSAARP